MQLSDPLFGRLGNAGAAFAPLQLAARPRRRPAPVSGCWWPSYGDGADAMAFAVSDHES